MRWRALKRKQPGVQHSNSFQPAVTLPWHWSQALSYAEQSLLSDREMSHAATSLATASLSPFLTSAASCLLPTQIQCRVSEKLKNSRNPCWAPTRKYKLSLFFSLHYKATWYILVSYLWPSETGRRFTSSKSNALTRTNSLPHCFGFTRCTSFPIGVCRVEKSRCDTHLFLCNALIIGYYPG